MQRQFSPTEVECGIRWPRPALGDLDEDLVAPVFKLREVLASSKKKRRWR